MKVLSVLLVTLGEAFYIIAEMLGSKMYSETHSFPAVFFKSFLLISFAGALVIAGYILGYVSFKRNIWVISAVSITTIVILEPLIALLVFKQSPTTGALIGFILGAIGLVVTIFV